MKKKESDLRTMVVLGVALVVPLVLASPAFAAASFDLQYQSNLTSEASLLQTAEAGGTSSTTTQTLSTEVQSLGTQIATLYAAEQTLVQSQQTLPTSSSGTDSSLTHMKNQLQQWQQQSKSAWHEYQQFNARGGQSNRSLAQKYYKQWANIRKKITSTTNQVNAFAGSSKQGDTKYQQGLTSLQNAILSLQSAEITYTQAWVSDEQSGSTTATSSTVTTTNLLAPSVVVTTDSSGNPEIAVSAAQSDATLTLYSTSGTVVETAAANSTGNGVFDDPASGTYYVVQTLNGEQSNSSVFVTVS